MTHMMLSFIWFVIVFCVFAVVCVIIAGVVFGIVAAIYVICQAKQAPIEPDKKCAYCPKPRLPGHVSCGECGSPEGDKP